MYTRHKQPGGFTLVELLVTAAIITLVFGGLMLSIQVAVKLISTSKARTGAVSLATERMEYIRALPYDQIGTISGIPSGLIPQNATTSLNGLTYSERVLIQYVDDPADGVGAADANGIVADYKRAKVEYSWLGQDGTTSISLIADIAPAGIESLAGGGTLTVNVFDAQVQPVAGAAVRVRNDTTTSTIDITQYTNVNGVAFFAGAPAAGQYQLNVTKSGYSTDGTYVATSSNPDPVTPPVAVIAGAVSTMNFQIDRLSTLIVHTVGPASSGTFSDTFSDASSTVNQTNVAVVSGDVVLSGGPGSYAGTGSLQSTSTTPSTIVAWGSAAWSASTTPTSTLSVQVYSVSGGVYTLVPESDLPGNSAGFTSGTIVLSTLNPSTYPSLALGAVLDSTDTSETPELHSWQISYTTSQPSIPNIPFTLQGTKIIGTTPVYKYQEDHTTDGGGAMTIPNLEWDAYKVTLGTGTYDIGEACSLLPVALQPNATSTLTLTLVPHVAYAMRVTVVTTAGNTIPNATVDISRTGFSATKSTSVCGQLFFNTGLVNATDYSVHVSAPGYNDQTITDVAVDGTEALTVTLTPS